MQETNSVLETRLASLPQRLSHVVRPWAESLPGLPALSEAGRVLTYGELGRAIERTGQWLSEQDVRPGDRVVVLGENCIAMAVLVLAIGEIDAWPVVVNSRISAREVDAIREHSGCRRVLCTLDVSSEAAQHSERLECQVAEVPSLGQISISPLNALAKPEPVAADGKHQTGALIYTSGTTGAPKGVMLSHHSILFTAATGGVLRGVSPKDRVYGALPMSHIVGFSSILVGSLMLGGCVELVPRFDPAAAQAALGEGITILLGVPAMYQRLLDVSGGELNYPKLRTIAVAGAPLDASLKTAVEAAFQLTLHNGYGITECAPTIAFTRMDDPRRDTTVGPAIPGISVRLHSPGPEGVGELHVRGPNVMRGYYKAPELTAAAIDSEGWFNTGDLARLDGTYLHIVGRTKELIIRSGFNVYPPEVESVLAAHPAVAACAVVGRKVPGNEEVVAFVQLRTGSQTTAQDLAAFVSSRLAAYKRPAQILIKDALPATTAGKILKHQLAKEASHEQ